MVATVSAKSFLTESSKYTGNSQVKTIQKLYVYISRGSRISQLSLIEQSTPADSNYPAEGQST